MAGARNSDMESGERKADQPSLAENLEYAEWVGMLGALLGSRDCERAATDIANKKPLSFIKAALASQRVDLEGRGSALTKLLENIVRQKEASFEMSAICASEQAKKRMDNNGDLKRRMATCTIKELSESLRNKEFTVRLHISVKQKIFKGLVAKAAQKMLTKPERDDFFAAINAHTIKELSAFFQEKNFTKQFDSDIKKEIFKILAFKAARPEMEDGRENELSFTNAVTNLYSFTLKEWTEILDDEAFIRQIFNSWAHKKIKGQQANLASASSDASLRFIKGTAAGAIAGASMATASRLSGASTSTKVALALGMGMAAGTASAVHMYFDTANKSERNAKRRTVNAVGYVNQQLFEREPEKNGNNDGTPNQKGRCPCIIM